MTSTNRRRLLAVLAAVTFCAVFATVAYRVTRPRPVAAAPAAKIDLDPLDRAETAAYSATLELARRALDHGDPAKAQEYLDACAWDRRGWEYRHLAARCRPSVTLRPPTGRILCAVFSPDGSKILTGGDDKAARVYDAKTGAELLAVPGHDEQVRAAAWHPCGATFVTAGGKAATIRDAETGRQLHTLAGHPSAVACLAFSADGRRLLAGVGGGEARIFGGETGKLLRVFRHEGGLRRPSLDPSGTRILSPSEKSLTVFDANSGRVLLAAESAGTVASARFLPDGERLLACRA